jgi:hypothetical protein
MSESDSSYHITKQDPPESIARISTILVKDILVLFATVLIWRGTWVLCDDIEMRLGYDQALVIRGVVFIIMGIIGLWLLLAFFRFGKGIL